jgi:HK97 family phage prohead protease
VKGIERRAIAAEFRVEGDEKPKIVGYAAKFNTLSEEMGGFREKIAPGAFKDALRVSDVRALFNHDPNIVLGRNKAGTLELIEDEIGLRYEITPPDTQTAKDILESIKRGDVTQSSFAFTMLPGGIAQWEDKPDGSSIRTIIKVAELFDVSPVTYPAYPDTESGIRSAEQIFKEHQAEAVSPARLQDYFIARARLALAEIE